MKKYFYCLVLITLIYSPVRSQEEIFDSGGPYEKEVYLVLYSHLSQSLDDVIVSKLSYGELQYLTSVYEYYSQLIREHKIDCIAREGSAADSLSLNMAEPYIKINEAARPYVIFPDEKVLSDYQGNLAMFGAETEKSMEILDEALKHKKDAEQFKVHKNSTRDSLKIIKNQLQSLLKTLKLLDATQGEKNIFKRSKEILARLDQHDCKRIAILFGHMHLIGFWKAYEEGNFNFRLIMISIPYLKQGW